jgi:predicted RNA-binding Zn-ribbon protein involved in translation (DUF1610 family)
MKNPYWAALFTIILGGALGWTAGEIQVNLDNAKYITSCEELIKAETGNEWLCPLCNRTIDHCRCKRKDYKNWYAKYPGKVFCGVLFQQGNNRETPEWIDPIAEESITDGDSDGWYAPNAHVKEVMIAYLNNCGQPGLNLKWWAVGIVNYPLEGDDVTTERFYKDVAKGIHSKIDEF